MLKLIAGYAYRAREGMPSAFRFGEGLVGQCALDKERILSPTRRGTTSRWARRWARPRRPTSSSCPCSSRGGIKAVIELASFRRFSEVHLDFLKQLTESIGVVLNTIAANMRTELLLQQSPGPHRGAHRDQQAARAAEDRGGAQERRGRAGQARARGEGQAARAHLQVQVRIPREHVPRAPHAAQQPALALAELSENPDGNLSTQQVEFAQDHPRVGLRPLGADQRHPRPRQDRIRHGRGERRAGAVPVAARLRRSQLPPGGRAEGARLPGGAGRGPPRPPRDGRQAAAADPARISCRTPASSPTAARWSCG